MGEAARPAHRFGGSVIQPSSGWPRAAPLAQASPAMTECVDPMDWFDLPDDTHRPADADQSRMRLYIAAGLLGIGALGMVGGLLHILPA
jgi:hypothetical protein